MKRHLLIFIGFTYLLSACNGSDTGTVDVFIDPTPVEVNGTLLYINNVGQPNILDVTYSQTGLQYNVEPWVQLNSRAPESTTAYFDSLDYRGVDYSLEGTYDWGYFEPDEDQAPQMAVVIREATGEQPFYNYGEKFTFTGVDEFQKMETLKFASQVYQEDTELINYRYWARARDVSFIDRNKFIVFYSEFVDKYDTQNPRPIDQYTAYIHYAIRFDIRNIRNRDRTSMGEVVFASRRENFQNGQTLVSARKNFYYMFGKIYSTTGFSPYVVKSDGSGEAYIPEIKGNQGYNRAPGNEAFAYDAHPKKDSVIVVSDAAYGVMELRLPNDKYGRFEILKQRPLLDFAPNGLVISEVFNGKRDYWFMKYSPDGTKVAIIHYGSNQSTPYLSIWYLEDNTIRSFQFPTGEGLRLTSVGMPAWDVDSPDGRYLFFVGADDVANIANFYYIDSEATTNTAVRVSYDVMSYNNTQLPVNQRLVKAVHMVQKKVDPDL